MINIVKHGIRAAPSVFLWVLIWVIMAIIAAGLMVAIPVGLAVIGQDLRFTIIWNIIATAALVGYFRIKSPGRSSTA